MLERVVPASTGSGRSSTKEEGDQMKGKAKEAVGDLTGNKDLKSEGKADRQAGEAKEKVGKVEEKVEEVIDKAKDTLHPKK
jgi:uncharacterized protein YjbJ (UPF0337 family)